MHGFVSWGEKWEPPERLCLFKNARNSCGVKNKHDNLFRNEHVIIWSEAEMKIAKTFPLTSVYGSPSCAVSVQLSTLERLVRGSEGASVCAGKSVWREGGRTVKHWCLLDIHSTETHSECFQHSRPAQLSVWAECSRHSFVFTCVTVYCHTDDVTSQLHLSSAMK